MLSLKYKLSLFISFILLITNSLSAQNEAFHGGDGDGFGHSASSTFNLSEINYQGNDLTVTVNQAIGQADPTSTGPVYYNVVFSEAVTGFDANDISFTGIVVPQTINITGSGANYTIELDNFNSNGEIIVQIPAGGAHNSVGNPNLISTSTDNFVIFNGLDLSVEISMADGQVALSNSTTVHFKVQFSESVSDFTNSDVSLSGTANASTVNVSGSGSLYDVAVSGIANDGTVVISIPAGLVHNGFGKANLASVNVQNTITCDFTRPNVGIAFAPGQTTPSPANVLRFTVTVSEEILALQATDIQLSGTAAANNLDINKNGNEYTISVSGMTKEGTVIISINANSIFDLAGNGNNASINTENEIYFSNESFTLEITQAASQKDPYNGDLAEFDIHFSRVPVDFDIADIAITGNIPSNPAALSGNGTDYTLSLSGFTDDGTVTVNVPASRIHDAFNNGNDASINTDNQVTIDTHSPTVEIVLGSSQKSPSNKSNLVFNALFNEDVIDFTSEDVQLSGTSGANSVNVSGSGKNYQITISGMNKDGNVNIIIPANICKDLAGNFNNSGVNIGNEIIYDISKPSVEIKQAENQQDPALTLPLNFSIEFSEDILEFSNSSVSFGGTAGVNLTITGIGKNYNVAVNGVQTNETIAISVPANMVPDLAGNLNITSINTDNSITFSGITGFVDAKAADDCKISYRNGIVEINFEQAPLSNAIMYIYSINGKLLYTKEHLNRQNSFPLNLNTLFIVRVVNSNKQTSNLLAPN